MGNKRHDERCHDCKDRVRMLLTAIFDRVEANWDLDLPAKVADYTGTSIYEILKKIHEALCKYRGFELFVKSKKLPRVDFFIPEKKLSLNLMNPSISPNPERLRYSIILAARISDFPLRGGWLFVKN
jgi:hypothetical protein